MFKKVFTPLKTQSISLMAIIHRYTYMYSENFIHILHKSDIKFLFPPLKTGVKEAKVTFKRSAQHQKRHISKLHPLTRYYNTIYMHTVVYWCENNILTVLPSAQYIFKLVLSDLFDELFNIPNCASLYFRKFPNIFMTT